MLSIQESMESVIGAWVEDNEELLQGFLDEAVAEHLEHNLLVDAAKNVAIELVSDSVSYDIDELMRDALVASLS